MLNRWKTIDRIDALCKKHGVIWMENTAERKIDFTAPPNKVFVRDPILAPEPRKTVEWDEKNLVGIIGWVKMYLSCLEEEKQQ